MPIVLALLRWKLWHCSFQKALHLWKSDNWWQNQSIICPEHECGRWQGKYHSCCHHWISTVIRNSSSQGGSDHASVMMGARTGVGMYSRFFSVIISWIEFLSLNFFYFNSLISFSGVQLKQTHQLLVHVHCTAHRLALAVSQSANQVPQIKKKSGNCEQHF